MKLFLKILKITLFPLIIAFFVIYILLIPADNKKINSVKAISDIIENGKISDKTYENRLLGIKIDANELEDVTWVISNFYSDEYYEHNVEHSKKIESDIVLLQDLRSSTLVEIHTQYVGPRKHLNKIKGSERYCTDVRNELIYLKSRGFSEMYYEYCKVSNIEPLKISRNTFYAFTITDSYWNTGLYVASIKHNDFGISFYFYNRDYENKQYFNEELIRAILENIKFLEPEIVYTY